MKIVLTGSSGFLGKAIFNHISTAHHVFTLSRGTADYNCQLEAKPPVFDQSFDCVIHCAGKAHAVPRNSKDAAEFFDVNVQGTENLLTALSKTSIPKYFVFISSVSVYGRSAGTLLSENEPLAAVDPYGLSKIEAEKLIAGWCREHNVICTILRLPLIVGKDPPGNLGSMIRSIKKGYYFNVAGGKARRSMVLVDDIAKYIIHAAKVGGVYNVTDGYNPSFFEISRHISAQLNKSVVLNIPNFIARLLALLGDMTLGKFPLTTEQLKKLTSTLTFDDTAARKTFGWMPTPVLDAFKIL